MEIFGYKQNRSLAADTGETKYQPLQNEPIRAQLGGKLQIGGQESETAVTSSQLAGGYYPHTGVLIVLISCQFVSNCHTSQLKEDLHRKLGIFILQIVSE